MHKSVLAAGIASVAILAGGSANATSIPFDDLAIDGNHTGSQTELLTNAGQLQNWKVLTVSKLPDLLHESAGLGHVILQVNAGPTPISNSNGPTPTPTTGSPVQVPEPGSLLLFLSGLTAMFFMRRQWRAGRTRA